jgi:hypothetical protein
MGPLFAGRITLVQEVVATGLLRDERRSLHAQSATSLEVRDPLLYAQHLDVAGSDAAAAAYLDAARIEIGSMRYQFAGDLVVRGIAVAGDEAPLGELHALRNSGSYD